MSMFSYSRDWYDGVMQLVTPRRANSGRFAAKSDASARHMLQPGRRMSMSSAGSSFQRVWDTISVWASGALTYLSTCPFRSTGVV